MYDIESRVIVESWAMFCVGSVCVGSLESDNAWDVDSCWADYAFLREMKVGHPLNICN